jgi:TolA-binding protein
MDEAVALLWRVVEREPRSARAGLALMDLGRLTQRLGRPAEAARAFGRYLELQPNGSFRDDARAGLCRALARSGDDGAARSCYASYLAEFPRGAHAGEAGRYGGDSPP